jgi:LacI family transcriptional regulator
MRTRLKDVAKELQLSPALVSGVLNRRPNVWASEETRSRIHEAARKLNYQPSAAAQALSKGRTNTISLVYRRLEGSSFRLAYSGLVDALSANLQASGYGLAVANFATNEEVMDHLQKLASTRAADAIVLWGREQDTEPQGKLLEKLRVPFLVKGRHEERHPHWNQIDFDHEGMMARAVEHLVALGHRKLAYLGFQHDEAFVHALRRGFVQGHEKWLGGEPDPRFFAEHDDVVAPNLQSILHWMDLPVDERPTAFVIGAGNAAWQALETGLAQVGRRLGYCATDDAAAGITSLFFTLMFGEAMVYQGIEVDNLALMASPDLLDALVRGEAERSILRFLPPLTPAPTLDLMRNGVSFAGEPR